MTLTTTNVTNSYAGNGVTTAFAVTFQFRDSTDLVLYEIDANGVPTLLVETTDYAVSGGAGSTGSVDLTARGAPASGETLLIIRSTRDDQQIDLTDPTTAPWSSTEESADRARMRTQELSEAGPPIPAFRTVASAASITVISRDSRLLVTGSTSVDNILGGFDGQLLIIRAAASVTFNNESTGAGELHLGANNSLTAGDILTLVSDGTDWWRVALAVN
jgi:hypothetical protein